MAIFVNSSWIHRGVDSIFVSVEEDASSFGINGCGSFNHIVVAYLIGGGNAGSSSGSTRLLLGILAPNKP